MIGYTVKPTGGELLAGPNITEANFFPPVSHIIKPGGEIG